MEQFERLGLLKDGRYDVTIFDVLGDVVCGGFASPLRFGFADKLVITCSDEVMSIFAGNNIARMVCAYAKNGVALAGLVANHRSDGPSARAVVDEFAARLGTRVLAHVARDPGIGRAERAGRTVAEAEPEAPVVATLAALAAELLTIDPATLSPPTPMDDDALDAFVRSLPPP
jgi:nitrogenase iron protein NifH